MFVNPIIHVASAVLLREKQKRWFKEITRALEAMREDPKSFWNWSKNKGKWQSQTSQVDGVTPLYHEDGRLLIDHQEILDSWHRHFQKLSEDVTGHSRDRKFWRDQNEGRGKTTFANNCLNKDITVDEVWNAVETAKLHKVPGEDGIPMDFIRVILLEKQKQN